MVGVYVLDGVGVPIGDLTSPTMEAGMAVLQPAANRTEKIMMNK